MILIPDEIQKDERLNWSEKALLSYYRYWTMNGKLHFCCKTDACVMDELQIKKRSFYRFKNHLKELCLIDDDGEKVIYTGGAKMAP